MQTRFNLPPHGPVVFAASLPSDIEIEFTDENVDEINFDDAPDFAAISIMLTAQVERAKVISTEFKKKGIPVIIGGIAAMLHSEELIEFCDSIFLGETEGIIGALIDDLKKGVLKKKYDFRNQLPDIAIVGTAKREILNQDKYYYRGVKMLDLVHASRGCRFDCFPCCAPFLGGKKFRPRPIEKTIEEVKAVDNNRLFFVDNSLSQNYDWEKELFNALIPLNKKWVSHPIDNSDELLSLAYKAGCWYVYQAVFDTSEVIRKRIKNYHDHGIAVEATVILGLDNHDFDYIKRLVDFLIEVQLDLAEFTIMTPFPHTPIRTELEKQGRILSNNWDEYTCDRVVFQPKKMTMQELQNAYYYAWETFYKDCSQELKMGELHRKIIAREMEDGSYKRVRSMRKNNG